MSFLRRHRVPTVLVGPGVLVVILVAHRVRTQQAAAVPQRRVEIVGGVVEPIQKDLHVKLAHIVLEERFPRELARSEEHMPA